MKLYIATQNEHKLNEIRDILQDVDAEVCSAYDHVDISDVAETGLTFEENSCLKAETLSKKIKSEVDSYVLADDSGLEVDALGGRPGVYSSRYSGEGATDEENVARLLEEMEGVESRKANFVCVVAIAKRGETIKTFSGKLNGSIAFSPRGENGFGYDPVFVTETGKTAAELSAEEKNAISHRKQAFAKAIKFIASCSVDQKS